MTDEERGQLSEEEAEARRQELRSLSQEERIRRARDLAAQARAQRRAAGQQAAPAAPPPPKAEEAPPAAPTEALPAETLPQRPAAARPPTSRPPAREERLVEPPVVPPPPGTVADLFREALPDVEMTATQTALDVAIIVRREDLPRVMQAAKEDPRLACDYLRCLSGVDQMERGLEVVYHLYSFQHGHSVAIKAIAPTEDPRLPSVTPFWNGANWHERETAELFGIVFEGHPDLRPLLTEEGLGYYILRKSHPLAEIEEWQEELLMEGEEAPE